MKILFVNPKISESFTRHYYDLAGRWELNETNTAHLKMNELFLRNSFSGLGLLTIASLLGEEEDIDFVDGNIQAVDDQKNYDVVAIGGMALQAESSADLASRFIEQGTAVVMGGVNVTTFPDEYKREGISIVIGEGEHLFPKFLEDLKRGEPKAVYGGIGGTNIDLRDSPLPMFGLVSHHRYSIIGTQTTRGCPYNCDYCNVSKILGTSYRHRSIESVLEEMRVLRQIWPRSVMFFCDENLFADKNYAMELFQKAKHMNIGPWATHADVSIYENRDLLDLISTNGEPMLAIGFETLTEANFNYIKNPMKFRLLPNYQDLIDELKDRGIKILGLFMYGFENDSEESLDRIIELVTRNDIDFQISIYTAMPGTTLFSRLTREYESANGPIKEVGASKFRKINDYLLEQNGYSPEELESIILDAHKKISPSVVPARAFATLALYRCLREGLPF